MAQTKAGQSRMTMKPRFKVPIVVALIFFLTVVTLTIDSNFLKAAWNTPQAAVTNDAVINTATLDDAINSATGILFLGEPIRTFHDDRHFTNFDNTQRPTHKEKKKLTVLMCDKWNVVTTIFAPSQAVIRAAKVAGWCTVIVADTKTPHDYMEQAGLAGMGSVVHYLSVQDQQNWLEAEQNGGESTAVGKFLAAIPYKHFARKNIGYLYAIQHGAKLLFDFDDDNLLPIDPNTGDVFPPLSDEQFLTGARMVVNGPNVFNHHSLMGATVHNSWARGFPLQVIQDNTTQGDIIFDNFTLNLMESVAVMQFCANGNPDIDAVHRLVHPLPMTFESSNTPDVVVGSSPVSTKGSIVVPTHSFAPYNAQATVHTYKALWALLLPFTVPGRVSDIWRGYFAEALFRDLGLSVTFLPPAIVQDRNEHHYLADMQAELDLYFKAGKLLDHLSAWHSPSKNIPERMEELWIDLYERGYIEINDVKVVQLWLSALLEINYEFPSQKRQRLDHTVLMGQFNYPQSTPLILSWHQKWRHFFNKIVVMVPMKDAQKFELQRHGIQAYVSRSDRGYTSPIENLAAVLLQYKNDSTVNGILYVHDDMLVNITAFFPSDFIFGNHKVVITNDCTPDSEQYTTFKMFPDGTFTLTPYFDTRMNKATLLANIPWFRGSRGVRFDGHSRLFADPRSKFMLNSDGSLDGMTDRQSDVIYVATSLADDFARSAELMIANDVFLECSAPKVVQNLYKLSNATVVNRQLCTRWDRARGTTRMLDECWKNSYSYAAYHPFKIGKNIKAWSERFDWVTTGTSSFV